MTANPAIANTAILPDSPAEPDDEVERSLSLVRSDAKAVVLYGSRARGTHRADSDVDVLAIVSISPGTFHHDKTSITYYTESHLQALARSGSLFIRHLREEARVVFDPTGAFDRVIRNLDLTGGYDALRNEIAVVLASLRVADRDAYSSGLARAGAWAARTALYLALQENHELTYDLTQACERIGNPGLADLIYAARDGNADLSELATAGTDLIDERYVDDTATSLADFTLSAWARYRVAPRILESVIAGESTLAYTELTLPP